MKDMKPSGNRNPHENKYFVTVSQSASPKRRFLIAILVAIILVVVGVLLAVLIPTYMRGKGKPESTSGNIQEQPNGKELDNRTKSEVAVGLTTRTSVFQGSIFNTLSSKQEGSFSPTTEGSSFIHYQTSVSRSSMAIYATTKKKKPGLSPGATSSLILLNTTPSPKATSAVSEKVQTPSLSSIVPLSTKKSRMSVSSITSSTSEVRPVSSVADLTVITNLLPNKGATSSLILLNTTPSPKATSAVSEKVQTPSISSIVSLSTKKSRMSVSSITSSTSEVHPVSSMADPTVIANLLPNKESKWSRWSSWSDCTKTCGTGSRYRNRTCVAINKGAVFAPISCAGKSLQTVSCAEWNCPDCSRNCTTGTLNDACDACTCHHHVLSGQVLTIENVPLSEVNISLAETPYNILAQTNTSGHFVTLGVCAGEQELLLQKSGFVPVREKANVQTPTMASITVKLEFAVPPFVTVHPKSKIRMPGQAVTFCCDGKGNPPPEIEWFKENNVIDKELYSYNNTLEISDVADLNGSFRCRVVNQFGSEFSKVAELKVVARSDDSCPSAPISKNQTLPPGCVLNGTNITILEVGECERVACVKRKDTFNSSCSEPRQCCGPRSFDNVLVRCGAFMSFTLSKIKTCGCDQCFDEQTIMQGVTVGQDGKAAKFVDLFFNDKQVDRTDADGMFSISVPRDTKRAIVTFKDQIFKKFQEEDKIFLLNEGQKAVYKVTLREKPKPLIFNASEPLDLPLGGNLDSFADLELPENSLLTEDGSVFRGNAKASVSVTDPRNLSDILTAPGDFTTVSEDGQEEILETYGMIKLNMEDDNGKPLVMSKPMKVYLDPEKLNLTVSEGNASVKLYWLDRKTGRWREAGDFSLEDGNKRRRKRTNRIFLAGTVTPSIAKEYLNFDWPDEIVGLRVTVNSGEDNVLITAIRKDNKGYVQRTTYRGVVCMAIWKDKDYYLQAEKDSKYYDPDKSIKEDIKHVSGSIVSTEGDGETIESFEFHSALVNPRGPIYYDDARYGRSERRMCEKSLNNANGLEKGRQFVFKPHLNVNPEYALLQINVKTAEWISPKTGGYCFIKVKITGRNTLFMATSYDTDAQEVLGFHIRMPKDVTSGSGSVTCLQFRCPRANSRTVVLLTPMTSGATCRYNKTAKALNDVQSDQGLCPPGTLPAAAGQEIWLCIPFSTTDMFTTFSGVPEQNGEARCLRSDQYYRRVDISSVRSSSGSSVEYTCS